MSNGPSRPEGAAKSLGDYAGLLRRRWRYPVLMIPGALLVAVFIAYILPAQYRSTSTIMLEPASLPSNMVQSMLPSPVNMDKGQTLTAEQQLELTRRRVMSKDSLLELVKEVDPYPNDKKMTLEEKASTIANDMDFESVDPVTFSKLVTSTTFNIYYDNPSPRIAREVNSKLAELFLTYNQRTRAEQAADAYRFLQTQSQELEKQMIEMEKKLAQFKAQYGDALPDAQGRNLVGIDRAQRDLFDTERDVRSAEAEESLLSLQLKDTSPSLTASVSDWRTELAKLRVELAAAEQKYTPEHPDVRRLRRAIADMAATGAAGDAAVIAKPDNPEYLRVDSQLKAKQRELAALRSTAAHLRSQLYGYEKNLSTAPNVEREYLQLSREYTASQSRYTDLQNKMKQAALSETLESQARGERFAMIRPSTTPSMPNSPNRIGIILVGLVLGTGLAVLLAVLRDASDPTVRGIEDLQDAFDVTPVGTVPRMLNSLDVRRRRLVWGSVAAGYAAAACLVLATIFVAD